MFSKLLCFLFLAVILRYVAAAPIGGEVCKSSGLMLHDVRPSGNFQKRSLFTKIGTRVLPETRPGLASALTPGSGIGGARDADVMKTAAGTKKAEKEQTPSEAKNILTGMRSSPLMDWVASNPAQVALTKKEIAMQEYERAILSPINYHDPY